MNYADRIRKVTNELLSDTLDYLALKEVLEDYKSLLVEVSQLDLGNEANRRDIQSENGIALGTSWAALCIDDIMRTRQFIRGIFKAVQELHTEKQETVRVFYAGSGPFASLVLPLMTAYSPEELQITLLEINPRSIENLKRVIHQLGFEKYIEKIVCEDATVYTIDTSKRIDILISETMQYALEKEQQVPIMLNLVNQLEDDTLIIPQNIRLDLSLMNTSTDLLHLKREDKYKSLSTLLEFDKKYIQTYHDKSKKEGIHKKLQLGNRIGFRKEGYEGYEQLVVTTSIQVYKEEWLEVDASGITLTKLLIHLNEVEKDKQEITIEYDMEEMPIIRYQLH